MKNKNLPFPLKIDTPNKDVVVSFVYAWARQQAMSIHEQRLIIRIMEYASARLDGIRLDQHLHKLDIGLWDVQLTMPISDIIIQSDMKFEDMKEALTKLADRSFQYEDDDEWWMCHFIESPKLKKKTGLITFRVCNDLWKVFTDISKGFRKFELNKALALTTGYAFQLYLMVSGQQKPFYLDLESFRKWVGLKDTVYRKADGKSKVDKIVEKIINPSKEQLDKSCPWTFKYEVVRLNPKNSRSTPKGFMFYPKEQSKFRDPELEKNSLISKLDISSVVNKQIKDYMIYQMGFTQEQLHANKDTLDKAMHVVPDFVGFLGELQGRRRPKDGSIKGKGWIINAIKSEIEKYSIKQKR